MSEDRVGCPLENNGMSFNRWRCSAPLQLHSGLDSSTEKDVLKDTDLISHGRPRGTRDKKWRRNRLEFQRLLFSSLIISPRTRITWSTKSQV